MLSQGAAEKQRQYRELDESGLNEFSHADYCDLLEVYLDVMPVTVATLEQAFARNEVGLASTALHKLKSNTSYICASDLSVCCGDLEKRLRLEPLTAVRDDGQQIIDRCRLLLDEIRLYLGHA